MYHEIILVGNLGNDPEMRFTPSGKAVANFSLATNRRYGDVDETIWWRVTVWEKTAENCAEYLSKGDTVMIRARMNPDENGNPRVYERKDGSAGAQYEVTAEMVRFVNTKGRETSSAKPF